MAVTAGLGSWEDPPTVMSDISEGEQIARRRKKLGWNQRELSKRSGVGMSTVLRIEKDKNTQRQNYEAVIAALAQEEAARGVGPTLSTPSGTTEPSHKEGVDAAQTRQRMRLETLEVVLVEALETVRRGLAEYAEGRDPKRKSG